MSAPSIVAARSRRSRLRRCATALMLSAGLTLAIVAPASATTETFEYTGSAQTFTVPAGVTQVTFDVFGAQGSDGSPVAPSPYAPGLGGRATATLSVTPGDTFQINVGGQGQYGTGGWNGGGNGLFGGGGGASDIRAGGTALADRVLVAGGGGGSGGVLCDGAGDGGGLVGETGTINAEQCPGSFPAGGGTQDAGGAGGSHLSGINTAAPGQFGLGAAGSPTSGGGGGGGGWYGGGAGRFGGGGGGSGHGPTGTTYQTGVRTGNGQITATYTLPNAQPTADAGDDLTVASQAAVSLDGSDSTDPDDDELTYSWTQTGGPGVTLSGADTASASFIAPVGPATLEFRLEVCDPMPLCHTDTVQVTVGAPTVEDPIETVEEIDLPRGTENSLVSKLTGAQKNFDNGDLAGACDKLAAFIAQVTAQRGKKIPEADADELIEQVQAVAESWGCG
jgi:Glycine rich protein